jgi:methionine-rich copper-binding protein CopC
MMKNLVGALCMVFASLAAAHTQLKSSVPAPKGTVAAPVREIELEFGGDVRLTAVVLTDGQGGQKKVADVPTKVASRFAVAVQEDLGPGAYTVTWRAVGADTHVVSGDFAFTVSTAAPR